MSKTAALTAHDREIKTWSIFLALAATSIVIAWANNEFVMTRETFYALAGNPENTTHLDRQFETVQRMNLWSYVLALIQTVIRVGFVALVAQLVCLLGGVEISFSRLFRVSSIAFAATLFGTALQILWVILQPASAITKASLGIVPDSIAVWFSWSTEASSLSYLMLSRFSITSLLWVLLMYWGLREMNRLRLSGAAIVALTTWLIASAVQVCSSLFLREIVG